MCWRVPLRRDVTGQELGLSLIVFFDKTNPREWIYSSRQAADLLLRKESIASTNSSLFEEAGLRRLEASG